MDPKQLGRTYFVPAGADALTLSVTAAQRGPLKVAVASTNQHLQKPSVVGRSPGGSVDDDGFDSPRTSPRRGNSRCDSGSSVGE